MEVTKEKASFTGKCIGEDQHEAAFRRCILVVHLNEKLQLEREHDYLSVGQPQTQLD